MLKRFSSRVDDLIKLIRSKNDDDDDDDEQDEYDNEDVNEDEEDNEDVNEHEDDDEDDVDEEEDDDEDDEDEEDDEEDDDEEDDEEDEDEDEEDEDEDDEDDEDEEDEDEEEDSNRKVIKVKDDDEEEGEQEPDTVDISKWDDDEKQKYVLSEQEPNTLHVFTHKPYFYLTDAQTRFSPDLEVANNNPIDYFLYIYVVCNNTMFDPYLACLLKYNESSKSYTFPIITYDPISLKDDETHDIYIQNMCYEIIYPLFQIEETDVDSDFIEYTKDCFKGSLYHDGMKHGYLCFNAEKFVRYLKGDFINLSEHFHKNETIPAYTWGCLDEITVKKRIHNVSVHPDVVDTFQEYEWLREIKNKDDENTAKPVMMYSCTIKNDVVDHTLTDKEKKQFFPPVSFHPVFGRVRLFTVELDELLYKTAFQMPRYIVFLGDTVTVITESGVYGVFSSDCIYNF